MGRVKDSSDSIREGIPYVTEADIADIVHDMDKKARIHVLNTVFSNSYFDVCPFDIHTHWETPAYKLMHTLHCKAFSHMGEQTKRTLWLSALECSSLSTEDFPYPFDKHVLLRKLKINWHMDIFSAATAAFFVGTVLGLVIGSSKPSVDHLPHQNGAAVIANSQGSGVLKPLRMSHARVSLNIQRIPDHRNPRVPHTGVSSSAATRQAG